MNVILLPQSALLPSSGAAEVIQVDGANVSWKEARFDADTEEQAFWQFAVPDDYDGGDVKVRVWWKAAAIIGDVIFSIAHRAVADDAVWDAAPSESAFASDTATGTTETLNKVEQTLSAPWSPGQVIQMALRRKADDLSDTMLGDAKVLSVVVEFELA